MIARLATVAGAGTALAIAAYLAVLHLTDRVVPCPIGAEGACTAVQRSEYGSLAGVPVSLLGALAAATVLVLALSERPAARLAAAGVAFGGVAFSLYLTSVEAFALEQWCAWCVASAACWTVLAVSEGVRAWTAAAGAAQTA